MIIGISNFGGMQPVEDPRYLGRTFAQIARNTKLTNGALKAWAAPLQIASLAKVGTKQSIYRFGQVAPADQNYWWHWTTDVNVVRGAVLGDTAERTYYTGDGVPKVSNNELMIQGGGVLYPNAFYTLGIPAPTVAPSAVISGTGSGVIETRAYGYTFVSAWGEEGPLSPTVSLNWQFGQSVNISALPGAPPVGGYNITQIRLYRSVTGTQAALFQLVAELPVSTTTYNDSKTTAELDEELPSASWFPPLANMAGLTGMANGMMAGYVGNDVYFCEPFRPHAWPPEYRQPVDHRIVGMGAFGATLLVATTSNPYLMTGVNPAQISSDKVPLKQSCVSKRSIVEMDGGVLYASPDGLVLANGGGVSIATSSVISVDEWRSYEPESIHAYQLDGRYFAFFDNGNRQGSLVFDFSGTGASMWETDIYCSAGYNENLFDALYLAIGDTVRKWDAGSALLTYVWRSKVFVVPRPTNFGFGQVLAQQYPVTLRVYADGVLRHTQLVQDAAPFRLPSGFVGREWELELEGTSTVNAAFIAQSSAELQLQ